jgi:hypothetical protein
MTPSDFYQLRAVECFTLAERISDPQERGVMHELALCWLRLLARASESRTNKPRLDGVPSPRPRRAATFPGRRH